MSTALELIWAAMNSPLGITAVSGVILYALNRLFAAKPSWAKYEGTIIAAIQYAEKVIPDGVQNKSLARLDSALGYMLRAHGAATGNTIPKKQLTELREGIQIVHANLKAKGTI